MTTPSIILTDIEGTTTDLNFVHKVLFPYARKKMDAFVRKHSRDPEVSLALSAVASIAKKPLNLNNTIARLEQWMDSDQKIAPLKTLQGLLWAQGYAAGIFKGHVYEDVPTAFKRWTEAGIKLYCYSSGSVQAQKLIFAHTPYGDLTPYFTNYYDTVTGAKRDSASYAAIAANMQVAPSDILFLSDIVEELDAAQAAGLQTRQIVRDGDFDPEAKHRPTRDFSQIA